jgi:hypothetical protein
MANFSDGDRRVLRFIWMAKARASWVRGGERYVTRPGAAAGTLSFEAFA